MSDTKELEQAKEAEQVKETEQTKEAEQVKEKESAAPETANVSAQNEIRETTGESVEIYDEDDSVDLSDSQKKKKFKKRYVVIPVLAVIGAGIIASALFGKKNTAIIVETEDVAMGNIENIISISGTVDTAETKNYFAEVAATIDKLDVKVGDKVSKGDVLYTFDQEALDLAEKNAELAITQAKGNYNSLFSPTAAADRKYAEGMTAQQINDRIDAITLEIDALNTKITEKTSRMNQTLTDLQKTSQDINQNGIGDSNEQYFENGNQNYIYRNENDNKQDGEYVEPSESNRQMALAVSQSIQDVQYALNNDPEIQGWKDQINVLKEEQSHLSSAKASQVNPGSVQASKAQLESTQLTQEDTIAKIQEAKEGVKADFNGVVTAIPATVMEGSTVATGTQILTMANLDDVKVTIQVSKSDLPKISVGQEVDVTINGKSYKGKVEQISGTATKNSNGVAVVATDIKITNPDSDIILGVEANNKIHAEKADNTIVLPYEYIQTDAEGDYVFVVENGVVVRKNVTLGITNSTEAQITEGISAGEKVITSDASILTEGMPVTVQ